MKHLIITCIPSNMASSRTCEILGGKLLEIAMIPEDNEIYSEGKRQVKIFKFDF